LDDADGLLRVHGSGNSIVGNHFSEIIDAQSIRPAGATPVIIRLAEGTGNFVSNNHTVAKDVHATSSDSCFEAQVDALLTTDAADALDVTAVRVEAASVRNTILDSGTESQVVADRALNAVRATPAIGA
jgi:inulin fructotransferase (DFA-I-forming)